MFKQASLRLTAVYLGIIMFICLLFSLSLYNVSSAELNRFLGKQIDFAYRAPAFNGNAESRDTFLASRYGEYVEAKSRLIARLFFINAIILVSGGMLSFYMARRTLDPIEEAHEAQKRFTADASHELRTPLTAMRTEIEVTLMNPKLTVEDATKQLESNLEEINRLSELSEGLLRLARLDEDSLQLQSVQLQESILSVTERLHTLVNEKHIKLTTKIPKNVLVDSDATALEEILTILLDNAIKHTPNKQAIRISSQQKAKTVIVSIHNQGNPINELDLPHIFERFYRSESSREHDHGGYGLGLAIAQKLSSKLRSTIRVSNHKKGGVEFILELPLSKNQYTSDTDVNQKNG